MLPADEARAHVLWLLEHGMGCRSIAEQAGVTRMLVRRLLGLGSEPTKKVRRSTHDALVAVRLTPRPGARVSSVGTVRRLQALATLGWSLPRIAARVGVDRRRMRVMMRRTHVLAQTAAAVTAVYEALWDQPPRPQTQAERAAVSRTLNWASQQGWLPPAAWDDPDTDREPVDEVRRAAQRRLAADAVIEDVLWLLDSGATRDQVVERVGRRWEALEALLLRHGRPEIAARIRAAGRTTTVGVAS